MLKKRGRLKSSEFITSSLKSYLGCSKCKSRDLVSRSTFVIYVQYGLYTVFTIFGSLIQQHLKSGSCVFILSGECVFLIVDFFLKTLLLRFQFSNLFLKVLFFKKHPYCCFFIEYIFELLGLHFFHLRRTVRHDPCELLAHINEHFRYDERDVLEVFRLIFEFLVM